MPEWLYRGPVVPVVLLIAAVAVVATVGREPAPSEEPAAPAPNEVWRCHACARAPTKGFIPCRSVTGRGNEQGARERVRERVCQEAGVPLDECEVTNLECQRLQESDVRDEGEPVRRTRGEGSREEGEGSGE